MSFNLNSDGDRHYREQLQKRYQQDEDSKAPLNESFIANSDRVYLDGEYIALPDVSPVAHNVSFEELAVEVEAGALTSSAPVEYMLCVHWVNFGVLGGVIFTVGLLAGMGLQSMIKKTKFYSHEPVNAAEYGPDMDQDDSRDLTKSAMV